MIEALAVRFVASPWGRAIVGALALLAALAVWGRRRERQGAAKARDRIARDIQAKTERGQDAFDKTWRSPVSDDPDDFFDRLRGRDADWRRLRNLR